MNLHSSQAEHMDEETAAECTTQGVSRLQCCFLATAHGRISFPVVPYPRIQKTKLSDTVYSVCCVISLTIRVTETQHSWTLLYKKDTSFGMWYDLKVAA